MKEKALNELFMELPFENSIKEMKGNGIPMSGNGIEVAEFSDFNEIFTAVKKEMSGNGF